MSGASKSGLLCVGIATLDYVYKLDAIPTTAQKYRARDLAVVGGGLAANAAVAAARLGGAVRMATRLGDDPTGDAIVAGLECEGVDCGLARRFPGTTSPVSAVMVDAAGERMVVSHLDPSIPSDPGWLPDTLPAGVDAVLGDTRWPEGAAKLFAAARAAGRPGVLDGDRAAAPELIAAASHVAFSLQGLRETVGIEDPFDAVAELGSRSGNWIGATVGAEGIVYWNGRKAVRRQGFRVSVVDTLAAGDVWHGAFALALAERRGEEEAIRFAHAASALKCTRFGGRAGAPTRLEVEEFLKGQP